MDKQALACQNDYLADGGQKPAAPEEKETFCKVTSVI
jgi:hypothetical protein